MTGSHLTNGGARRSARAAGYYQSRPAWFHSRRRRARSDAPYRVALCLALAVGLGLNAAEAFAAKGEKAGAAAESGLTFSPRGGAFGKPVSLEISSSLSESTIRYTVDGSEPNEASAVYKAPLALTNSTLVRAKAFAPDHRAGVSA